MLKLVSLYQIITFKSTQSLKLQLKKPLERLIESLIQLSEDLIMETRSLDLQESITQVWSSFLSLPLCFDPLETLLDEN